MKKNSISNATVAVDKLCNCMTLHSGLYAGPYGFALSFASDAGFVLSFALDAGFVLDAGFALDFALFDLDV